MKSQVIRLHVEFVKDIMAAQALFYQSLQTNFKNYAHWMYENHRKQGDFKNYFIQTLMLELNFFFLNKRRKIKRFQDFKLFAPDCTIRKPHSWELNLCLQMLQSPSLTLYHADAWLPVDRGPDDSGGSTQLCMSLVSKTTMVAPFYEEENSGWEVPLETRVSGVT